MRQSGGRSDGVRLSQYDPLAATDGAALSRPWWKPELEVFNAGDIELIAEGLIDGPPFFQLVLGVQWCAPADPATMMYMRSLLPDDSIWAGIGMAQLEMPMAAQAVLLGGNVRVGLEENLYLKRGVFATNGQLVERARTIIESLGQEVASPQETREILDLKNCPS